MNIVRSDVIGNVDMQLVSRPTNTCAGVDNYFLLAKPTPEHSWCQIVRFVGTDEGFAHARYNSAVQEAQEIYSVAS